MGYRFFFFSLEGYEPPHIHIEKGEKYAKFWLNPVSLARNRGFKSFELKEIMVIIEDNSVKLIEEWNEYFKDRI